MQGHGHTIAEIDKAWERVATAISRFPEGYIPPAMVQVLFELYLGALDAAKENNQQARSAGN